MFDSKGISSIPASSPSPDKIRAEQGGNRAVNNPAPQNASPLPPPAARFEVPVTQFTRNTPTPQSPQPQQQPVAKMPQGNLPGNLPGNLAQMLGGNAERVMSQVVSFFYGNKKDTVDEKELDKRRRNAFAETGLFEDQPKVEQSNKGGMGGGQ